MLPPTSSTRSGAVLRGRFFARAAQRNGVGHGEPADLRHELVGVEASASLSPEEGRELEVAVLGPGGEDADQVAGGRRVMTWERFAALLKHHPLPPPRIVHSALGRPANPHR